MASEVKDRLYQDIARRLLALIENGTFSAGSRLPAERELAIQFDVSRPVVREALIALEVQGLVEVRVGSGAYVLEKPEAERPAGFNVSAFELTEARLLIEGEAAALAAIHVTDEELAEIERLVRAIERENRDLQGSPAADRDFHLAIARATRNTAMVEAVANLWLLRETSPESALLHEKARSANVKPVVEEHSAVLDALRARDPNAARSAMRAHLSAVLDSLLFATEEQALEAARKASRTKREIYSRITA